MTSSIFRSSNLLSPKSSLCFPCFFLSLHLSHRLDSHDSKQHAFIVTILLPDFPRLRSPLHKLRGSTEGIILLTTGHALTDGAVLTCHDSARRHHSLLRPDGLDQDQA